MNPQVPVLYRNVVERLPDAALLYQAGVLIHANPEALRRLREARLVDDDTGDLSAVDLTAYIAPEDRDELVEAMRSAAAGEGVAARRLAWLDPTGTRLVTSCVFNPLDLDDTPYLQILARDVTIRARAEAALADSEAQFRALFDHSPVGVAVVIDRRFAVVNPALCHILGRSEGSLVGRGPDEFTHPEDVDTGVSDTVNAVRRSVQVRKRYVRPDGSIIWGELTATRVEQNEHTRALLQLRDITGELDAAERLRHIALHDSLTGLGNRVLLEDRLEHLLAVRTERRGGVAVLFIDLDSFKRVNDALGHSVGDRVLKTAAQRIRQAVRPGDTVTRWGGDEFVVLLDGLVGSDDALTVVQRIESALGLPVPHRDDELLISASIGIAYAATDATATAEQLLHEADAAMYRAKQGGRSRHSLFDEALGAAAARRGHIEQLLAEAADGRGVVLHYQPIVNLSTRRIVGAEALLRLRDSDGSLLYPDAFLDIAEDIKIMTAVETVVIGEATRWAAKHQHRPGGLMLNVNICPGQLDRIHNLEATLRTSLAVSGLNPEQLTCEITEHAILDINEQMLAGISRIQASGVRFSLDDFGTGYASMKHLHALPLHEIKIDRQFVAFAGQDTSARAIVRGLAALTHDLSMQCVAEGIEDEAAHALAVELGADLGQGYLYSPPVADEAFEELLAQQ